MKHPFSKPVFFIIPSALALVAAAVLYAYLYGMVGASADRARLAEDIIGTEQGAQSQSKSLQDEYASTADARSRLPGLFVPAGDAVAFIEALESIGPASGATVSISSINADPLDGAAPGTTGIISADVTAQGSWAAVERALVLSESLPYQNTIDHVSLIGGHPSSGAAASKDAWQISYRISALLIAIAVPPKS